MSDPTQPQYIVWTPAGAIAMTQDRERAREWGEKYLDSSKRLMGWSSAEAKAYRHTVQIETVPPEWPRADWCGKDEAHEAHTWGGAGWSPFVCQGHAGPLAPGSLPQ